MRTYVWPVAAVLLPVVSGQYIPQSLVRNPPSEATALKSWAFLKESMGKIGDQVMQLMLIRKDVTSIQDDLKTQVELWHQAQMELGQENAKLCQEEKQLETDVRVGDAVRLEVTKLEELVEEEKRRATAEKNQAAASGDQKAMQMQALEGRRKHLQDQLSVLNATTHAAEEADQKRNLDLQNDGAALAVKIAELQATVKDVEKQITLEKSKAAAETVELQKHLADLKEGVKHMTSQIVPLEPILAEQEKLKQELKQKTAELVGLQQAQNQPAIECQVATQELNKVLAAEQYKASTRNQEAAGYCQPVKGQHDVLEQELAACQAKVL